MAKTSIVPKKKARKSLSVDRAVDQYKARSEDISLALDVMRLMHIANEVRVSGSLKRMSYRDTLA
jgi:hypothetical protein